LFQRLKDGVISSRGAGGKDQTTTTSQPTTTTTWRRRRSCGDDQQQQQAIAAPRYTRIYDEVNRLTSDFRQSTVDNPLP